MSFIPFTGELLQQPQQQNGQYAEPLQEKKQVAALTNEDFGGLDFIPAKDAFPSSDEVQEVDEADLFNFAAKTFNERVQETPDGQTRQPGQSAPVSEKKSLGEIMPEGMIEISAEMYVEILEGAVAGLCQMFGDENGKYLFNKVYKEKYTEITKTFFKYQNVQITPGQLFVFCTIAIISGSGLKAYKDRRAKVAVSKFQKRSVQNAPAGTQLNAFELNEFTESAARKNYEIDENGYFKKTSTGEYAKKGEREKCPEYLLSFIVQYQKQNGKWPGKKEVETYQNFNK